MRKLSEIKEELLQIALREKALQQEVKLFQKECPHPKAFVVSKFSDSYDNCGAPVYEETFVTHTCLLCEVSVTKSFDKDRDTVPTIVECLPK